MSAAEEIPDLLEVAVPIGGRVLVVADLHLSADDQAGGGATVTELTAALEAATGPGVLVVAGNLFSALSGPGDVESALAAHPRLTGDIARFASGEGRRVVVLPGERDMTLASSAAARTALVRALGAELALAVDLRVATGAGERTVRVDPGYGFCELTAYRDPRNPLDSPYGRHIREQVMPTVRARAARPERPSTGTGSPGSEAPGGGGPLARRWKAAMGRAGRAGRGEPGAGWLAGVEQLDDIGALSRFVASRLVYRRLIHSAWLLVVPVVAALVLRLPATVWYSARHGALATRVGLFVSASFMELLLFAFISFLGIRVTNRTLGAVALGDPGLDTNGAARAHARDLVTRGYAGLITATTCRPELTPLGAGFFAGAGAGAELVTEYPNRLPGLGLPSVFLAHRTLSWVELEAGNDLHARLFHARQDLPGAALVERLLASRDADPSPGEMRPEVVATFPHGEAWPRPVPLGRRDRRVRRVAAAMLVAVGFLSLVSSMSDPVNDRLQLLRHIFPLAVPQTAAAIAAFVGVALIVLARGIRRGQRRAWAVCELLLVAVAGLNLVKGVDVEEALIALVAAALLYVVRDSFQARTDVVAVRRGLAWVLGAAIAVVAAGTLGVEISTVINHTRHRAEVRVSWLHALQASLYRMVGSSHVTLPPRVNAFLAPTMATATAGLVLALAAVVFRPVVAHRRDARSDKSSQLGAAAVAGAGMPGAGAGAAPGTGAPGPGTRPRAGGAGAGGRAASDGDGPDSGQGRGGRGPQRRASGSGPAASGSRSGTPVAPPRPAAIRPASTESDEGTVASGPEGLARARGIVDRHGASTLDYFALRPDKDFFFWGDTLVAHGVYGGVCLVSPDPVGPVAERDAAWRAFRRYVDAHGWALGGLGMGEDWLPIYRSSGMHDLYVGDEGVVRVDRFTLEGGRFKGLRQAVNRVAKYGYRISFHDPSQLDPGLRDQLKDVMTKSRRGDVERGFSMTLGRVFDEADDGLLLAVVHAPVAEGAPEGTVGEPVAFCQYVPAPGIGGYSLDLMRRDDGEHPNGLIDFAVVETIRELQRRGQSALGLNFATMRAVLAGEAGEGLVPRVQAWLLRRMGDSMQIESLWKFNAKFDPDWQPRYAIYDAPENSLAVAIAVARAESFWELPVIGRFLVPSAPAGT
ncbi:MAG: DUF2156 domain-containing protein [Acidobacteriota bacterium]|nr:DUF2156 domain-containing protein [Acidobacteriota bacterium]